MIRAAEPDDAWALTVIESEVFGPDAWNQPQVLEELTGAGRRGWVALPDEETAGELVGYAMTMTLGEITDLQRIAVLPERRRTGIARRLLDRALAAAEQDGADRMLLEVSATNRAAMRFYTDAGFTGVDRRPRYYRDGSDAVVMRRSLARGCRWA